MPSRVLKRNEARLIRQNSLPDDDRERLRLGGIANWNRKNSNEFNEDGNGTEWPRPAAEIDDLIELTSWKVKFQSFKHPKRNWLQRTNPLKNKSKLFNSRSNHKIVKVKVKAKAKA